MTIYQRLREGYGDDVDGFINDAIDEVGFSDRKRGRTIAEDALNESHGDMGQALFIMFEFGAG